jgi:signal transduction histidine kinase
VAGDAYFAVFKERLKHRFANAAADEVLSGARQAEEQRTRLEAQVDSLRLEQVITNLLDNAIKYSPDGGVVDVSLRQLDTGTIELSVRDRGIGIPSERRDQIFQRFYQAHDGGHRSGMGIGLFVSQQIIDLHNGAIHAEFPADGGTRFIIHLPPST